MLIFLNTVHFDSAQSNIQINYKSPCFYLRRFLTAIHMSERITQTPNARSLGVDQTQDLSVLSQYGGHAKTRLVRKCLFIVYLVNYKGRN